MRIRDIRVEDVKAGTNWRVRGATDVHQNMPDWEIEECSTFRPSDTVVYSALAVLRAGEVRPLVVIREVGTYEWWGDTCEYVDGAWRELVQSNDWEGEEFVASPLTEDPSFMGEYSHERQRAGFARWRDRLRNSK